MRLIDANELKELYEDYEGLKVPCEVVLQNIDDMPTAYDIDKVVEQLEGHAIEFEAFGICSDYVELTHAIGIVKGGAE